MEKKIVLTQEFLLKCKGPEAPIKIAEEISRQKKIIEEYGKDYKKDDKVISGLLFSTIRGK